MNVFLLVLGCMITTLSLTFKAANALQCLECQDMPSPEDCRIITTCSDSSKCFVEQVVTSGGVVLYNTGCTSISRCTSKRSVTRNSIVKRQDTVSSTDIVTCLNCCDGDFCNIEGCGKTAIKPPQRPPICFTCDNQLNPNSCRDVSLCDPGHMCVLHQAESISIQWKSECMPILQCETLEKVSLTNEAVSCYTCCKEDFCNNKCNQHTNSTSTTLAPASATTMISSSSGNQVVTVITPTKHTTIDETSTLSAATTSGTTNATTISISSTLSEAQYSSSPSPPVKVSDKTTVPSAVTTDTTTSMQSSSISNPSTTYQKSTDYTYISSIPTTDSYTSSSNAVGTSTKLPMSTTFSSSNTTTPSYAQTTRQIGTLHTETLSTKTNQATTQKTDSTTSQLDSTVSTQPSVTSPYSVTTMPTSVPNTSASILTDCNNRKFDICFVLDSSGSIGQDGFAKELQFVSQMVHTVASETTADADYCVVRFSTFAQTYVHLQQYNTPDLVQNATVHIPFRTGETNTDMGLQHTAHEFHIHGRQGAERITILITDGKSNNPTKTIHTAHNKLIAHGSDIYAIGIGVQADKGELAQIVSDSNHLLELPDIDHLNGTDINILHNLCYKAHAGNGTMMTNTTPKVTPLYTTQTNPSSANTETTKQPYTSPPKATGSSTMVTNTATKVTAHTAQTNPSSANTETTKQPYTIPPTATGHETVVTTTTPKVTPYTAQTNASSANTATTKQPYTIPPKATMCAVCSGPDFLCEQLYAIKQCVSPNNYCVNKVVNKKDGSRMVTRGCAPFQTCYDDWFIGTSDDDKCTTFDENNILTLDFECTYCCIQDSCNVPIKPAYTSLYKDL